MLKNICLLGMLVIISFSVANAATVENYVKACVKNQNNRMGPELCECVGKKAKGMFNADEFDFFYATAVKDSALTNKYNLSLKPQQKMKVIMFNMQGPSRCANELASQEKKHKDQDSKKNEGSTAVGSSEAATSQ